jgi:uncharacterized protein (TIRG00374 family)
VSSGRRSRATVWIGIAFGLACIVLFSWNAHWTEIGAILSEANVPLIVLASGFLLTTSVARAWRWRHLLRDERVSFRHRLTSTLIGFAGNNTLPGRLGEPLRCWAISKLDGHVSFWQAAGSILIERLFDLTAALLLLVAFFVLAPSGGRDAAFLARMEHDAARIALVVAVAFGIIALLAGRRLGVRRGWYARIGRLIGSVQDGFAGVRSVRAMAMSALYTVVLWSAMLEYELLMLHAFGFTELGLRHALGLLVVLSFAIALPQAPAGVGVVQLAAETTLTALFGLPLDRAKAFAIGLWACQVGVVVGAGALALWVEGLSLGAMRDARGALDRLQAGASPE